MTRYQIAKRATFVSALTNSSLAICKMLIGYLGNSNALFADGVHSFSDLIADALVLIAAKMGGQIPDQEHPYGHQRIETIATLIIAIFLALVAFFIGWEMVRHLIQGEQSSKPDLLVILVAIISIIGNEGLYHYTIRVGRKINSNLLIANAWHNRTDSFVSILVLISIVGTILGFHYLDAIGTLIIAVLILKISFSMFWTGIKELIDTGVDNKQLTAFRQCIKQVPGVRSVHQLRTRLHSGSIFVDVHIIVDPTITVSEGHYIGEHVHLKLMEQFKDICDVVVHIDAEDDEESHPSMQLPSRPEITKRLMSAWNDLPYQDKIQKINLHYLKGKIVVDVYLPLITSSQQKHIIHAYQAVSLNMPQIKYIHVYFGAAQ